MRAEVRSFASVDWMELSLYLREHWGDLPILDRSLFNWRFSGFGEGEGSPRFAPRILWGNGEVLGFLGAVPGRYQIQADSAQVTTGEAITLLLAHPQAHLKDYEEALLVETERRHPVTVCFRASRDTAGNCKERGYASSGKLLRHLAPLETRGYLDYCVQPPEHEQVEAWAMVVTEDEPVLPSSPEPTALGRLWLDSTLHEGRWVVQGLHRSPRYWQWRYLDRPGGDYLFFGDPPHTPAVVAKVEDVLGKAGKVLRLLEIVPRDPLAWTVGTDEELAALIRGAAVWAREVHQCVAIDYHVSSSLLMPTLAAAGLRQQPAIVTRKPYLSLAENFNPLFAASPDLTAHWKSPAGITEGAAHRWCFTRAEADLELAPSLVDEFLSV